MTRAPSPQTQPTRRRFLEVGLVGVAAGLAGCHRSSENPTASADDAAQRRAVEQARNALAAASALAAHRATKAPVRKAASDLASSLRTQLRALGADPTASGSTASQAGRTVPAGRQLAAVSLASIGSTSGPMARLLTCVAAGTLARTQDLAGQAGQPSMTIPHAGSLPALDNDDLLPRIGNRPPVIDQPVSDAAADAFGALSTALRTAEYGYGLVAARQRGSTRTAALDRMGAHRRAALALDSLAISVSRQTPAANLSYPVAPPATAGAARALARRLELDVAFAGSRVVADLDTTMAQARGLFADHLVSCALATRRWGSVPALPGMNAS